MYHMEGNFITPRENLFKDNKEKIESSVDALFDTPEKKQMLVNNFFGIEPGVLSPNEEYDFELFARYAQKRIFNASFHKKNIPQTEVDVYLRDHNTPQAILLHDIAHTIVTHEKTGTTVPEFYKTKPEAEINNPRLIAEEAQALVWVSIVGDAPVSLALFDAEKKKALLDAIALYKDSMSPMTEEVTKSIISFNEYDFESYLKVYQDIVYGLVELTNSQAIVREYEGDPEKVKKLHNEYIDVADKLKQQPDPKLVMILKNVFDDRENPKVLYNEFSRICGDLITRLHNRK